MTLRVDRRLTITALGGIPTVEPGDDLAALISEGLTRLELSLCDHDVLIVTSKLLSRAEDCFVDLSTIEPSTQAMELASEVEKDPRLVELVLRQSISVSRKAPGVLITRHRLGFVSANAAIDASNAAPGRARTGSGPWVLTMPLDPDKSASTLRASLEQQHNVRVGLVVSDSQGRPFRLGTVGMAVGTSGVPPLCDHRGREDRFGRVLEATSTAVADQLCAIADLVAGQSSESRPVTHVRGLTFDEATDGARTLIRPADGDLYV